MSYDPERRAHQEWIGYLQPVGLVVSPPALIAAGAMPDRNVAEAQESLRDLATGDPPLLADFPSFARLLLDWEPDNLAGGPGGPELPESLTVPLTEYGDHLRPTFAVPEPDSPGSFVLLIQVVPPGADLDGAAAAREGQTGWGASPQARLERLLRETGVPAGLLVNGAALRLVSAPKGETAGHVTFPVAAMGETAGRPILAALRMLLGADRLFTLPTAQRLPALLRESRKYQNLVSTRLAGQVLDALHELVRGFQAADEAAGGAVLRDVLGGHEDEVYGGLLATLLRLVFVLYAEDRGLVSSDPVYVEHYSVGGLFVRLRDDAAQHPDTMDQRFGAWPRLLTLFRLLHDGAAHGGLRIPARHGRLFSPDAYPFLEGRPRLSRAVPGERVPNAPRVADGVVLRVLTDLLVLDGERISYRALDVEQIGSVYEAIMGFTLGVASGPVVALPLRKKGSAVDVHVDLAALLALPGAERARRLSDEADCDLTGAPLDALKAARTPDDVAAALGKKLSKRTPRPLPAGSLYLQPTEERRRSGSHYTPRSLTEPIVRTTLEPALAALGDSPTPQQVLDLKVCDPAMGSGAFLVESCRFLGDALLRAWDAHGGLPDIPPDEDPVLFARRQVAQLCLYGVDKNPFAVDLAKLSLWLATLARDHPFTFLDDALRHGDSLVGLSPAQIERFHWEEKGQQPLLAGRIRAAIDAAMEKRARIETLNDEDHEGQEALLAEAEAALADVRLAGDLVIAAFFGGKKAKEREGLRARYEGMYAEVLDGRRARGEAEEVVAGLRAGGGAGARPGEARPVFPFHWELEFPEVFSRENPGFDAFVGNPPFAGAVFFAQTLREGFAEFVRTLFPGAEGKCDLVAFFFRRCFKHVRSDGCLGLVATNSIAQGDTRDAALAWICENGGAIHSARRRVRWPGLAAVAVAVVHVKKGLWNAPRSLDGHEVSDITAFLLPEGGNRCPEGLEEATGRAFRGTVIWGSGFLFDDDSPAGTPLAEMQRILGEHPPSGELVFPYMGGEELSDSPTQSPHRFVINFGDRTLPEAEGYPGLLRVVVEKVRPGRLVAATGSLRNHWWQFGRPAREMNEAIRGLSRVLVQSKVCQHLAFAFQPTTRVFADTLTVFAFETSAAFAVLQSRVHELWARVFSSSLEDRLRYTPSVCFETFPFPPDWERNVNLEMAGAAYYELRGSIMVQNSEGLTRLYNRFHDPDETSIDVFRLRELHDAMDRAVLDAYGWPDLRPACGFLLEYEDENDERANSDRSNGRRRPWRYRWPDDVRDLMLGRLLTLNRAGARRC